MTAMDSPSGRRGSPGSEEPNCTSTPAPTFEVSPQIEHHLRCCLSGQLLPRFVESKVDLKVVVSRTATSHSARLNAQVEKLWHEQLPALFSESDYELFNSNNVSIHYWSW